MRKHRGGVLTQYESATPLRPSGYDGTAPSSSLALLAVAFAMPSERRLESGAVALVTRLAPLSDQALQAPLVPEARSLVPQPTSLGEGDEAPLPDDHMVQDWNPHR